MMIYGVIKPISTAAFGLGQYWFDHSMNHHIDLIAVQ
jgi:hypothetical protein